MFSKDDTKRMKGIAILMLLFHHLFYNANRIADNNVKFILFSQESIQYVAVLCRVCVWIFIFLSAYGWSLQYRKKENVTISKFILKKWLSLMQPFLFIYVCIAIAYGITVKNLLDFYHNNIIHMILDMFGWADFFGTPMLLGAWWYMCLAQIMIFLFPALYLFCQKLEWVSVPITFLILQSVASGIQSSYGGAYVNYFIAAIFGIIFAQKEVLNSWKNRASAGGRKIIETLAAVTVVIVALIIKEYVKPVDTYYLSGVFCAIAVLGISRVCCKMNEKSILAKILKLLGTHSGNIYMIHAFFYMYFPITVYWSRNVLVSWLSLIFIGLAFSYIIEWLKQNIGYNKAFQKLKKCL